MDFQNAIKALRQELGKTQVDIAKALHISSGTVSRWELGSHYPNRSVAIALLEYAESHGASKECIARLSLSNKESVKRRQKQYQGDLFSIEHSSLEGLVEYVRFPIYVCDIETDELLYLNKLARQMVSADNDTLIGKKCYECIMHRNSPCEFCHKSELKNDAFTTYDAFRPFDGTSYRVQGKLIRWNGRAAQIRCVSNVGQSVTEDGSQREEIYKKYLAVKSAMSSDSLATAHFNLSKNTVGDMTCKLDSISHIWKSGRANDLLEALRLTAADNEGQKMFEVIRDRIALMNMFYIGKTHISVRHHINADKRLYETTFDLLQNPATFDIEAVAAIHPISGAALADAVSSVLLCVDYEAVVLIDAVTGETHSIVNGEIDDLIVKQKGDGNNTAGAEVFILNHCDDGDVKRIAFETGLPNVISHLKSAPKYSVAYSLKIDGKIACKRLTYAYLDSTHSIIFCAVQDVFAADNNSRP